MKQLIDIHTHLETLDEIYLLRSKLQNHIYRLEDHIYPKRKTILSVAMYVQFYQNFKHLIALIRDFRNEVLSLDGVKLIQSESDLEGDYQVGIVLHIESARTFTDTKDQLEEVYDLGVRGIIPMHFHNNRIGQSCDALKRRFFIDREDPGLSEFGHAFVHKCEQLGMWLDITHCTDQTAQDIIDTASHVMVSHTGIRDLVKWKRNVSLETMKKIAAKDGIIGLIPWQHLIGKQADAYERTIGFALEHGLEKSICIGSDYGSPIGTHPRYSSLFDLERAVEEFGEHAENIKWNNAYSFFQKILK